MNLIDDIWHSVREYIPDEHAIDMAGILIRVFENNGFDNLEDSEVYNIAHSEDME